MRIKSILKTFLIILGINFALSACIAPAFDSNENQLLAQVKVNAQELAKSCATLDGTQVHHDIVIPLEVAIEHLRYRPNDADVVDADKTLLQMSLVLEHSFTQKARPSRVYCEEKLRNVADGADRLMRAYSVLED